MQSEMHTRLSRKEGGLSPESRSWRWIRSASRLLIAGVAALASTATAVDFRISAKVGPTNAIQDAVDQCPENDPAGCRILLQGKSYTLINTLFIRNKSNITITTASPSIRPELVFQDDGSKAGPDSDPDTLAMKPAGWKHWPIDQDAALPGGSKNSSNPFSTNGIQRNGVILIQGSHNITLDGIGINGKAPLGWGTPGVWGAGGTFYGNFGVNLYLSGKVTVRNCEIKNCFSGFFIMNRNLGGALAHKNPGDLDASKLAPGSRYGEMGGHLIEQNLIHDNIWGAYEESNYDLGNTWRFNRMWDLHNSSATMNAWVGSGAPTYNRSNYASSTPALDKNGEAANQQGGFLYMKDNVAVPDKIYHNTFVKVTKLFAFGGWRGGTQHYFYNNLITDPWLDYNTDTSSFLTGNFSSQIGGSNDKTASMGQFMYDNTFAIFPKIPLGTSPTKAACPSATKDSCYKSLKLKVWDPSRLSFQTQSVNQGVNVTVAGKQYYNVLPLKTLYYIDAIQNQIGNSRPTIYQNDWKLEYPASDDIKKVSYTSTVEIGNNGASFVPPQTQAFTYQGRDSSVIAYRFGRLYGLPEADTIGLILKMGDLDSARSHQNHYIKSVPMNLNPTSTAFMTPVWTDKGVDSVILNRLWNPAGATTPTGLTALARGAMQPDGSNSVPMLMLMDDQPAMITGRLANISFDLSANVTGVTNLKWVSANFIPSVSDGDNANYKIGSLPIDLSGISSAPSLGLNTVAINLPADADWYSRIELLVSGQTADGRTIYSNIGLWLIRKSAYSFNVSFHKAKFSSTKQDTVRAGDAVWMRVEPVQRTAITTNTICGKKKDGTDSTCSTTEVTTKRYTSPINTFSIKSTRMYDADPSLASSSMIPSAGSYRGGKYVPATGVDSVSGQNVWWVQTYFTKSGMAAPVMTALAQKTNGEGDTGAVFQGAGSIYVRPGVPYVAELKDPASYRFVRDSGFAVISYQQKAPAKIEVKDKYGNIVDEATKVTLAVVPATQTAYVGGGTDVQKTIDIPATGVGASVIQATGTLAPEPLNTFWLYSWIGTGADPDAGTLKDTAKVLVKKPDMIFDWDKDSLSGIVKDTFRITLSILNSELKPFPGTEFWGYLKSKSGKLKFYAGTDVNLVTPLDSVDLKATGTAELIVTSDIESLSDTIYAVNSEVNSGDPAVIAPVNFKKPPEPPYPVADSAAYLDTDCDGKADLLRVWLMGSATSAADLDTSKTPVHGMTLTVDSKVISYDSTEWKFATGRKDLLEFAVKDVVDLVNIPGKDLQLQYTMRRPPLSDTVVNAGLTIDVKDRVAPRVDTAVVIENYSSPYDVFMVRFTEPVNYAGQSWPFVVKGAALANTASIVVDSFLVDPAKSLGANTYRVVIHNNRDAQFKPTLILYTDSLKIDPAGVLVDGSKNHGVECSPLVPLTKMVVLPSFTGKITTTHPQGRANVVVVTFSRPLLTLERIDSLEISFNGYKQTVATTGSNWSSTDNATWTLTMSDAEAFRYGVTRGSVDDKYGALVTAYGRNLNPPVSNYLPSSGVVADSVPAVLVHFSDLSGKPYAQLTFGDGVDSIRIKLSEPVSSVTGTIGLANAATSQDVGTKDIVMVDDLTWIVVQDTLNANRVNAGDTVALGNRFKGLDALLPTQGANVSKAVVIGGDRGPVAAFYSDSNGVGTASQLTLTFAKPLTHEAIFRLMWPAKDGSLQSINVMTTGAVGKTTVTMDLSGKFPEGVTGAEIKELGIMTSILTGSDTEFVTSEFPPHVRFAIADSVAPIIDSARMIYGAYEGDASSMYDTLKLYFSESVKTNGTDINKAISKLVGTSDVALTPKLPTFVLAADGKSGFMLFDTTTGLILPEKGDSIRLIAGQDGGILSDAVGAVAGVKAKRTVVQAGLRKAIEPSLNIILPNPNGEVRTEREQIVLKPVETRSPLEGVGSNLAILIGNGENANSVFTVVSKGAGQSSMAWGELNGTIGIDIPVNTGTIKEKSLITVVLYDKYGTFVGNAEATLRQSDFNSTNTNKSGKSSIKILWDGRSATKQIVSSGVYTARILFYREELMPDNTIQRVMLYNKLKNIGVAR